MFHELKSQLREVTGFESSVHVYEGVQMGGSRRFSILPAVFGSQVGRMLGWVFAGGGLRLKYNCKVI